MLPLATKQCGKCKAHKSTDDFSKYLQSPDGLQYYCKPCGAQSARERVKSNPEKAAAASRKYKIKSAYGLSVEQFHDLWETHSGKCAICTSVLRIGIGAAGHAIDHNHETGAVRGLLCCGCNRALGLFKDSPNLLVAASAYLTERGHYGDTP